MTGLDFTGKLVGRYRLISPIGSGTYGSIYKAVDTSIEDSPAFAIKCIPHNPNAERRLQQLAEIENHAAVLGFPNVMMLHGAMEEDGHFFLVLSLCEMDMFRAIWKGKLYWRNDALIKKVFIDILDGVLACHKKGIFHRDLKPENIMCSADGTKIQIGDFGLSTDSRLCEDGGCGTTSYMSPECFDSMERFYYADTADVWSLGVILFNMVTGRHPWDEARPRDRGYRAFCSTKKYLLRTSPISEGMNDLLDKIWHPTPTRRISIPEIRQAIMEIDTFYRAPRSSRGRSPLSKELTLVDPQETFVAPTVDEKKNKICTPANVLENAPLCCLD